MPIGVEAEATQVYEEARSALGSLITQIVAIIRNILDRAIQVAQQFVKWAGDNPLAAITMAANICIWVS